jgi:hypothetical protein
VLEIVCNRDGQRKQLVLAQPDDSDRSNADTKNKRNTVPWCRIDRHGRESRRNGLGRTERERGWQIIDGPPSPLAWASLAHAAVIVGAGRETRWAHRGESHRWAFGGGGASSRPLNKKMVETDESWTGVR